MRPNLLFLSAASNALVKLGSTLRWKKRLEIWDKRKDGAEDRVVRTERESDNRRRKMADLLVFPRPAKSVQNGEEGESQGE